MGRRRGQGDRPVFRMEEERGFQESVWSIGATIHEAAPKIEFGPANSPSKASKRRPSPSSQQSDKKKEPIRNRSEKVGRNDRARAAAARSTRIVCMRQTGEVSR